MVAPAPTAPRVKTKQLIPGLRSFGIGIGRRAGRSHRWARSLGLHWATSASVQAQRECGAGGAARQMRASAMGQSRLSTFTCQKRAAVAEANEYAVQVGATCEPLSSESNSPNATQHPFCLLSLARARFCFGGLPNCMCGRASVCVSVCASETAVVVATFAGKL